MRCLDIVCMVTTSLQNDLDEPNCLPVACTPIIFAESLLAQSGSEHKNCHQSGQMVTIYRFEQMVFQRVKGLWATDLTLAIHI